MKFKINNIVELITETHNREIFLFGIDYKKAISFLEEKLIETKYIEGFIKLVITKG